MQINNPLSEITSFDERRDFIIPGNLEETVLYSASHFLEIAKEAIRVRDLFTIALSGGQTPHAIFQEISKPAYRSALDWSKVLCFWSDERSVPPTDPESNYSAAMLAGLSTLPLKPENIFRMEAEKEIESSALAYEEIIRRNVPSLHFDLIMLGMGEDGHTASLFPHTKGLHTTDRLVIANHVPQKDTWRMSMTFECIHMAKTVCIYALGSNKADMVAQVLLGPYKPDEFPVQQIGTATHKVLWILDQASSEQFVNQIKK